MRSWILRVGLITAFVLSVAVPAGALTFRDRLIITGSAPDGTQVSSTVVDVDGGDFISVSTSRSEPCTAQDGSVNTVVTLQSISIPDAIVDVPQLLKSVDASGVGSLITTVIDRCAPSTVTTTADGISVQVAGERTSKIESLGGGFFRGTGVGTVTLDGTAYDVTIRFDRNPQ